MKNLFYLALILLILTAVACSAQTSYPSGYTTYYNLRLWAQGATPSADSLNQNWIDLDTYLNNIATGDTISYMKTWANQTATGINKFTNTVTLTGITDASSSDFKLHEEYGGFIANSTHAHWFYFNGQTKELNYIDTIGSYQKYRFWDIGKILDSQDTLLNLMPVTLSAGDTINMYNNGTAVYGYNLGSTDDTLYITSFASVRSRIVQLHVWDDGLGGKLYFRAGQYTTYLYSQNGGEAYTPTSSGIDIISIVASKTGSTNDVYLSWVKNYNFMSDP